MTVCWCRFIALKWNQTRPRRYNTFERSREVTTDTETKSQLIDVLAQMKSFQYFFGIKLGGIIFGHCDNLSRTLQHTELLAAEGQSIAALTVSTLQSICTDEMFNLFWSKLEVESKEIDIDEPQLPRARKAPRRYEIGQGSSTHPDSPKSFYHIVYFEALDLVINAIKDRFD